ncbi:cupin domain-containing protein [Kutzneria chonburiensis]|uniref:Cupin domain-containing protein n=1 Tax=Kutzneria chonburiensis TaxID=1483604 RepID=A0ABV6MQ27_9PSEU
MMNRRQLARAGGAAAALGLTAACASTAASSPTVASGPTTSIGPGPTDGVVRVQLQRLASPNPGWDIVQTRFEIPVGKESGRHRHPGPEVGYIVQGDVVIEFDDRPSITVHSGQPFLIPTGVVHNARNIGQVQTMMLSTYVIDAGKPLVTVCQGSKGDPCG